MTQRERASGATLREPRNRVATAWSGLYQRMAAAAALPLELGSEGPAAAALTADVFPDGVAFTQLDAVESWQHSRRLLSRLADEGLTARVEAVSGPMFLRAVERAVEELGEAIGVRGVPVAPPSPRALADAVTRFSYAVGSYTRALAAQVSETNEASIERFLSAVAPIDEMRAGRDGGDEDAEPEMPGRPVSPNGPDGPFGPPING